MTTKRADQLSLSDRVVLGGKPCTLVSVARRALPDDGVVVVQYQDPYTPPEAAKRWAFPATDDVEVEDAE